MIKVNKKIKILSFFILGGSIAIFSVNHYLSNFSEFEVDLNSAIYHNKQDKNNNLKTHQKLILQDDPFEIIKDFKSQEDIDKYFLKKINIALYNPPLTNKLYPKSNLYGHELIRYFDK